MNRVSRLRLAALLALLLAPIAGFAQTYVLAPVPQMQFLDADGAPLSGGLIYTYTAGTTNALVTYSANDGTQNANPVVLDSAGRATIYLASSSCYKFVVKDSLEVTEYTQDNICGYLASTSITIDDADFTIQDDGDTTKKAKFQASGISASTTRTFTFPDASTTLVGTDATQTLTNKTLTSPTISSPTISGTAAVSSADGLTINSVIAPQQLIINCHAQAATAMVDQTCFTADRAYQVTAVKFAHATAESTAATLYVQVVKDTSTNAPGAGTDLLTNNTNNGFDCKATANTVQSGTLTGTTASLQLAAGDRLSLDFSASATELVGVTITIILKLI